MTMQQISIATLICLLAAGLCLAKDSSITGILIQGKADNETYLAVESEKPVIETSPEGEKATARRLQIAGLSPEEYSGSFRLLGQRVTVKGTIMFPETVHHHTPILIIAKSLAVASQTKTYESEKD
jgi:hypothetical protein